MKKIPLTRGQFALIDDEDYPIVSLFKWCASKEKYTYYAVTILIVNDKKIRIFMHRLIANVPINLQGDHRNGDGLDNQKANLRVCTHQENSINKRKSLNNKSSVYKGVSISKGHKKWRAEIRYNYKKIQLGYFNNEQDAAMAYNLKASELFGEFAKLNSISRMLVVSGA